MTAADAIDDLDGLSGHWAARSIDELVVGFVRPAQLAPLLEAAARSAVLRPAGSPETR